MARDLDRQEKEAREKALRSHTLRQEAAAAYGKLLAEKERELESYPTLIAHQRDLLPEERATSLQNTLMELQTIQVCLLTIGTSPNAELMKKTSSLATKCQTLSTQVTALLRESDIQEVVIHAPVPVPVIPVVAMSKEGKWSCNGHRCPLELRSMPYGPKARKNCVCDRPLNVSFHCAEHKFDICPFCAADYPQKPTWRSALHSHLLALRHRQDWSCRICRAKGSEKSHTHVAERTGRKHAEEE